MFEKLNSEDTISMLESTTSIDEMDESSKVTVDKNALIIEGEL
jgi:hypothetical protein